MTRARAAALAKPMPAPMATLDSNAIRLGTTAQQQPFGLTLDKLLDGRMLIQGSSGAGKSWLLRRLLEQSSGDIQQIIIDPEGEFKSLADSADYPLINAERLDGRGFAALGLRVREQRLSVVLDVSQMDRESQMTAVAGFVRAIIDCPREHWHPALVAIDEAHLFAPFGGQGIETGITRRIVTSTIVDLMSRGRKRGLATVLATQRFARLSKSVASEATNFLVGQNVLDLDIKRAAEIIGWDTRRAQEHLPALRPGRFVASGNAFNTSPAVVTIGEVRSHHIGAAPAISAPPLPSAEEAHQLLGIDTLNEEAEADESLPAGFRAVRDFIADTRAPLATRIYAELAPLYPNGARIADLPSHLKATDDDVKAAMELLEKYAAIASEKGAVRLDRTMGTSRKC